MLNPTTTYRIQTKDIGIKEFFDYPEEYIVRPPYQRKNVWSINKQQALLDSLFRRFYIPRIVLREIRKSEKEVVLEVIDGQQRINTAQRFFNDQIKIPSSLMDIFPNLSGLFYSDLDSKARRFVDRELKYSADIVTDIDDSKSPKHQEIATEIFWRLQQGETLNYMEVAHSQLSSLARNFVVKYADDIRFDYKDYKPIDFNPDKHKFFKIIDRSNDRMQHLALLTRFLIIEDPANQNGIPDIKHTDVEEFIKKFKRDDGIDNLEMENMSYAQRVLKTLNLFYEIFQDDSMLDSKSGIKELSTEYFIVSVYLLLRHLKKFYVFDTKEQLLFHDFVIAFHERLKEKKEEDVEILLFSDNNQQSGSEIEIRHRIIRQLYFEYIDEVGHEMITKDNRRAFNEAERIKIYRRDNGLCQMCLEEGKSEQEAQVTWNNYDADHVIPHSRGGQTTVDNAQVLCKVHNRKKSAKTTS